MRFEAVFAVATVQVVPLFVDLSTLYPTIAVEDTFVGAVQEIETDVSPATVESAVGALGASNGVDVIGLVAIPLPARFVAATRNAYVVPLVKPVAVYVNAVVDDVSVVHVAPPSDVICTTYAVMALPPLLAGAVQERTTCLVPAVAVIDAGIPGMVYGVAVDVALAVPLPTAFTADTRKLYKVAFVKPVTVYRTA